MVVGSQVVLTATERVTLGMPAAEVVAEESSNRGARKVFILASSHLNQKTDEICRIAAALGSRHVATHVGGRGSHCYSWRWIRDGCRKNHAHLPQAQYHNGRTV